MRDIKNEARTDMTWQLNLEVASDAPVWLEPCAPEPPLPGAGDGFVSLQAEPYAAAANPPPPPAPEPPAPLPSVALPPAAAVRRSRRVSEEAAACVTALVGLTITGLAIGLGVAGLRKGTHQYSTAINNYVTQFCSNNPYVFTGSLSACASYWKNAFSPTQVCSPNDYNLCATFNTQPFDNIGWTLEKWGGAAIFLGIGAGVLTLFASCDWAPKVAQNINRRADAHDAAQDNAALAV